MGIGESSPTAHWVVIDDNTVRVIFLLFAHFLVQKRNPFWIIIVGPPSPIRRVPVEPRLKGVIIWMVFATIVFGQSVNIGLLPKLLAITI